MLPITIVSLEAYKLITRFITGKLLSEEQLTLISDTVAGKILGDWLSVPKAEADAKARIESAQIHIAEATRIISEIQHDLESQSEQLDKIVEEIEEKKKVANHYSTLIQTNKASIDALRNELAETVRGELKAQEEKGKRIRQVLGILGWLFTLVVGAALGAYFPMIMQKFVPNFPHP